MGSAERALQQSVVAAFRQLATEHRATAQRMGRVWSGHQAALEVADALHAEAERREQALQS